MKAIEVVNYDDVDMVGQLTEETFANREPGFQIDGVRSKDQLFSVFGALKAAAPAYAVEALHFDYVTARFRWYVPSDGDATAHTDTGPYGLAVHQNISDFVPVTLAVASVPLYNVQPGPKFSSDKVSEIRAGQTTPGRLTVFSEGGFEGLMPTVHYFDRRSGGDNLWVRYTHNKYDPAIDHSSAAHAAIEAFGLLPKFLPS